MEGLILKSGGVLEYVELVTDDNDNDTRVATDVTHLASTFLFDTVQLADDVRLKDIFSLLQADPTLVHVFRRDFAAELLDEILTGPAAPYTGEYSPEGLEYLELYHTWHLNSKTREHEPVHRLSFHGVGFELREDLENNPYFGLWGKGDRIPWGISLSSPRELLNIPLRIKSTVAVKENDTGRSYGQILCEFEYKYNTLGQIIKGVLWELSFHGDKNSRASFRSDLHEKCESLRNPED